MADFVAHRENVGSVIRIDIVEEKEMSAINTNAHLFFMKKALEQARAAAESGNVPIGCVIVQDKKILVADHNRCNQLESCLAHAEVNSINQLLQKDHNVSHKLSAYVTVEPCLMCIGLIRHLQIKEVIFGAYDHLAGATSVNSSILPKYYNIHKLRIIGGVLADDAISLIKRFVSQQPLWADYVNYVSNKPK